MTTFYRFIIHNDQQNPTVSSLEDLDHVLKKNEQTPNLLVVSGLQMMDNYPFPPGKKFIIRNKLHQSYDNIVFVPYFNHNFITGQRISRVKKIQRQMKDQNEEVTRIHFEMASFIDKSLLEELTTLVVPHADSLGMNEQELPNLHSMLHYGNVSFVSDSNPRTAVVLGTKTRSVRL